MKIVKVSYTAKPDYAEQNAMNIKTVMNDLQQLNHPGISYHTCLCADGKSFIHTAFFKSEDDEKLLIELPSFKYFQEQLRSAGLELPPKQELLTLVGSSKNIFNT
jgi:hypothetical protein